jgi:DNA-binding beta-propeller fold protein YncE
VSEEGNAASLRKLLIDSTSKAVEYSRQISLLPSGRVVSLRGLTFAITGTGGTVCLLADVYGGEYPREQSDILFLEDPNVGVVSYFQMLPSPLVPINPGCSSVAAVPSMSVIFCAVVEASQKKNYIVKIFKVDDDYMYHTALFAGAPAGYSTGSIDGTGTNMRLNRASSMVTSADGSLLYVAEQGAHKIRLLDISTADSRTICGSLSSVPGDHDGQGTNAGLRSPSGIALTSDGLTLIISEAGGNRVRALDLTTLRTTTLAGALDGAAGLQVR